MKETSKRFVIKEAWLLDENNNKVMKLTSLEGYEIPNLVNEEEVRGGKMKPYVKETK